MMTLVSFHRFLLTGCVIVTTTVHAAAATAAFHSPLLYGSSYCFIVVQHPFRTAGMCNWRRGRERRRLLLAPRQQQPTTTLSLLAAQRDPFEKNTENAEASGSDNDSSNNNNIQQNRLSPPLVYAGLLLLGSVAMASSILQTVVTLTLFSGLTWLGRQVVVVDSNDDDDDDYNGNKDDDDDENKTPPFPQLSPIAVTDLVAFVFSIAGASLLVPIEATTTTVTGRGDGMITLLPVIGIVAAIIGILVVQLWPGDQNEIAGSTDLPKPKSPQQELMELWDQQLEREEKDEK